MRCNNCGFESLDTAVFCPHCGVKLEKEIDETVIEQVKIEFDEQNETFEQTEYIPCFRDKVGAMLKSGLFLTLCILVSASAAFGISAGTVPILNILATIFLWLVFSKARKNQLDIKNLRCLSGVVYASYVINWVIVGIFGFVGVICATFSDFMTSKVDFFEIIDEIREEIPQLEDGANIIINNTNISLFMKIIAFVIIILAVFVALFNVFGIKKIHSFTKSFYQSAAANENMLQRVNATTGWLLFLGIVSAIGALGSISESSAFLSVGASSASYFVAYALIKKHFNNR